MTSDADQVLLTRAEADAMWQRQFLNASAVRGL